MPRTLIIGTRGSKLALRQVELVLKGLRRERPDATFDVREIKTEGDRSSAPLSEIGGFGVFTKALEDALLAGTIDVAVHSLKDLPPDVPAGLTLAAIPERGDPRDALVTRDGRALAELPPGARIGTGSGRRAVQLKALRPDIETEEIRGNVDTRIRKVDSGEYDGVVLAIAGLERLGLSARASHVCSVDEMVPAVGQAALAVETRTDDAEAIGVVRAIDDADTRVAVMAERAFLRRLGAGCRLPVGAYARLDGGEVVLDVIVAGDGNALTRRRARVPLACADERAIEIADEVLASVGGVTAP